MAQEPSLSGCSFFGVGVHLFKGSAGRPAVPSIVHSVSSNFKELELRCHLLAASNLMQATQFVCRLVCLSLAISSDQPTQKIDPENS